MLNPATAGLLSDQDVIDRLFQHIDEGTTDLGTEQWKEPVSNYTSKARFDQEIASGVDLLCSVRQLHFLISVAI